MPLTDLFMVGLLLHTSRRVAVAEEAASSLRSECGVKVVAVVEVDALMQDGAAPITAEAAAALSTASLAAGVQGVVSMVGVNAPNTDDSRGGDEGDGETRSRVLEMEGGTATAWHEPSATLLRDVLEVGCNVVTRLC